MKDNEEYLKIKEDLIQKSKEAGFKLDDDMIGIISAYSKSTLELNKLMSIVEKVVNGIDEMMIVNNDIERNKQTDIATCMTVLTHLVANGYIKLVEKEK